MDSHRRKSGEYIFPERAEGNEPGVSEVDDGEGKSQIQVEQKGPFIYGQ